jgi:hypothetical protein
MKYDTKEKLIITIIIMAIVLMLLPIELVLIEAWRTALIDSWNCLMTHCQQAVDIQK